MNLNYISEPETGITGLTNTNRGSDGCLSACHGLGVVSHGNPFLNNTQCFGSCYPADHCLSALLDDYYNAGGICQGSFLDVYFPGLFPVSNKSCELYGTDTDTHYDYDLKSGLCSEQTKQLICEQNCVHQLKPANCSSANATASSANTTHVGTDCRSSECFLETGIYNTVGSLIRSLCDHQTWRDCWVSSPTSKRFRNKKKNKRNKGKKYKKRNKIKQSKTDNPFIIPDPCFEAEAATASVAAFPLVATALLAIPSLLAPLGLVGMMGSAGMSMMTRGQCGGPIRCVSSSGQCCMLLINISGAGVRFRCPASC